MPGFMPGICNGTSGLVSAHQKIRHSISIGDPGHEARNDELRVGFSMVQSSLDVIPAEARPYVSKVTTFPLPVNPLIH